jgi:hypothetical protein
VDRPTFGCARACSNLTRPHSFQGSQINTYFSRFHNSSASSISNALSILNCTLHYNQPTNQHKPPLQRLFHHAMGEDVCFSILHQDMVRDAIRKGYSFAKLLTALAGECSSSEQYHQDRVMLPFHPTAVGTGRLAGPRS